MLEMVCARTRGQVLGVAIAIAFVGCSTGSDNAQSGRAQVVRQNPSGAGGTTPETPSPDQPSGTLDGSFLAPPDNGSQDAGSPFDPDAYWASDPPPASCDGGPVPPAPGGTPECPDDKNREGCPCHEIGAEASCWPGLRKNRERGICRDGHTVCEQRGEFGGVWGACKGYILPDPKASEGARACRCFSAGQWHLSNTSPCIWGSDGSGGANSTVIDADGKAQCASDTAPPAAPSSNWSTSTLQVDCAGHFRLCYTLKAGDVTNPQPTDCTVAQVCAEGDYSTPGKEQSFPDLPGWGSNDNDCVKKFVATGGYGEMSVVGLSVECDDIADHVFNRVGYCPASCNQDAGAPECAHCSQGGSGKF